MSNLRLKKNQPQMNADEHRWFSVLLVDRRERGLKL